MKTSIVSAVVAVVLLVFGSAAVQAAGAATARGSLDAARAKARAWQADAVLIGINTSKADAKGRASSPLAAAGLGWTYVFRSGKARQNYYVAFGDSGVDAGAVPVTSIGAIADDFVDSDRAMAEAAKNGFAPAGEDNSMALAQGNCRPAGKEPLCWKLTSNGREYFLVSAKSGKFLGKSRF